MGGADAEIKKKAAPAVPSDDDQHESSEDSDFIDERRPMRPPAKRRTVVIEPDDSNTNCSICTRPWHSSGDHRICCLRCGHLFGRSCIQKWIELRACCPECQKRARLGDVTVLFTSKFAVKDTGELHDLSSKVEHEQTLRRRAESELLTMRQRYTRLEERFAQLRSALARADAPFVPVESVALQSARVLHAADDGSLLVSCAYGPSHGFRRFSLLDLHAHQRFHRLHRAEIRDLHSNGDGLAASASLDKQLKITSLKTESCVAELDVRLPVWSCCFRDALTIVAGTANGQLVVYDLRRPSTALAQVAIPAPRPIATLRWVDGTRLLCAGPGHVALATLDQADPSRATFADLPIDGKRCIGAAFDIGSRSMVVTLRSDQRPLATHSVIDLETLVVAGEMSSHTVGITLARPAVFSHDGRRWVGSGDQEMQAPRLWDVSRPDQCIQLSSQQNGVVDMSYVNGTLITLSSSTLNIYKGSQARSSLK